MEREELILGITADIDSAKANLETLQTQLQDLQENWDLPGIEAEVTADLENAEDVVADLEEELGDALELPVTVTGADQAKQDLEGVGTAGAEIGSAVAAGTRSVSASISAVGRAVGGLGDELAAADGPGKKIETVFESAAVRAAAAGLAIGFAVKTIKDQLDFIAETNAWNDEQVEEYRAAVDAVGVGVDAVGEKLRDAGEFSFQGTTGLFGLGGGEQTDAAVLFGNFGITVDEVTRAVQGGEGALAAFEVRLQDAGLSGDLLESGMRAVRNEADNYAEATNGAAARTAFFDESIRSADEALQGMLDEQEPMRRFSEEWDTLVKGLADGSVDTQTGADALNTLSQELGLTTEEVLALAQAQVDEGVAGAQAYADALGSVDFRDSDIQGATSAFAGYTAELFAAGNETQRVESAYAAMAAAVGDGTLNLNTATESGRAQQDALEGVAAVLDGQLAQAYDTANGSQADFAASATALGDETLARLQTDLGLTDGQVNVLRETLGLTAADYEARFELAGVAEAQLQLGLLQGAIEGLPPEAELRVNTLIAQGEYVAARDEVAAFYAENPAPLPAEVVMSTTEAGNTFRDFADEDRTATITGDGDTSVADVEFTNFQNVDRIAKVSILVPNFAAARDTIDLAAKDRTSTVDIATGTISLPSSAELRNRIGTIHVPVQAYWNTRIEGNRPV